MTRMIFAVFLVQFFVSTFLCHGNHGQNTYQKNSAVNGEQTQTGNHQQQQVHHQSGHEQVKANINTDHVLEHLEGVINKPKDEMTIEEQNFYYFKLHDYDGNNKLDGLELVSAFAHNDEHKDENSDSDHASNNTTGKEAHTARIGDNDLIKVIDEIMRGNQYLFSSNDDNFSF
jgi:hypothetical protein